MQRANDMTLLPELMRGKNKMTQKLSRNPGKTRRQVGGFTLIEVLIALIVLSVGMLGIASLYVHSLSAGRTSMFRHNAVMLAGDVADRIRANPRAMAAYEGAGADNGCVDGTDNCTPAEMAAHDILLWSAQAVDGLPEGDVTVDYTAPVGLAPDTYRITISWTEIGEAQTYEILIPVRSI